MNDVKIYPKSKDFEIKFSDIEKLALMIFNPPATSRKRLTLCRAPREK